MKVAVDAWKGLVMDEQALLFGYSLGVVIGFLVGAGATLLIL